jgi:predicted enzyme related to lactoylglutathione lyase
MTTLPQAATTATISLTLDCVDLERLANFWSQALGYQEVARVDNFVVLAPEFRAQKNRMHIDLWVPDIDSEAARLEALGAKRLQDQPFDEHGLCWFQLADLEGNEFCVGRA